MKFDAGEHAIHTAGRIHNVTSLERAHQFWHGCMNHPGGVNGIVIDEFYPDLKKHFPTRVEALQRVRKNEPGKLCLLYLSGSGNHSEI